MITKHVPACPSLPVFHKAGQILLFDPLQNYMHIASKSCPHADHFIRLITAISAYFPCMLYLLYPHAVPFQHYIRLFSPMQKLRFRTRSEVVSWFFHFIKI